MENKITVMITPVSVRRTKYGWIPVRVSYCLPDGSRPFPSSVVYVPHGLNRDALIRFLELAEETQLPSFGRDGVESCLAPGIAERRLSVSELPNQIREAYVSSRKADGLYE